MVEPATKSGVALLALKGKVGLENEAEAWTVELLLRPSSIGPFQKVS